MSCPGSVLISLSLSNNFLSHLHGLSNKVARKKKKEKKNAVKSNAQTILDSQYNYARFNQCVDCTINNFRGVIIYVQKAFEIE